MKKRFIAALACVLILLMSSCNLLPAKDKSLDPDNPITVTVWNYYNGTVKDRFDELVLEFNDTIGTERGIVIEAQSYGDVNELADALFSSANAEIGSLPMPDVFAAYPDNVFRVDQIAELVNLKNYFSQEELGEIRGEFLEEGIFGEDQELKILPIAKSTENLYLNKTFWDGFANASGASLNSLSTWEGLAKTAKLYYEYTGKAFFGVDANANYMLISAMQLGEEMYNYQGDLGILGLSEDTAYKIWTNYYVPYINGYYAKIGRFSSDDAKTGQIAAYTGSTAGASYFPREVADGDKAIPVEVITLPYPFYEGGEPYAVQQGAGMCITKSDNAHEYAAALFLKWFIDTPQNINFAVSTGYLPVKSENLNTDTILSKMDRDSLTNKAVQNSIITTMEMFETYSFYGNKPFQGSYEARSILETNLASRVKVDLKLLKERVENGEDREAVINELSSKEQFFNWYQDFTKEISTALK
ncbi:MAG: prx [Herbinix sp.]|jgi:multiple sugar transport system substrate-binding protein|nr:prx [Herbinix sp.]